MHQLLQLFKKDFIQQGKTDLSFIRCNSSNNTEVVHGKEKKLARLLDPPLSAGIVLHKGKVKKWF